MPRTLRLSDGSYMRRHDIVHILSFLEEMKCVEVVGFSNIGKSALLRLLSASDVWLQELGEAGKQFVPVYIDCNRMLDMSEQGFYEAITRSLLETSLNSEGSPELKAAYDRLVAPESEFQIPLSFNQALTSVLQSIPGQLVLLIDEFDEPFKVIDARVFLNLRALKDRYDNKLVYVTSTVEPLSSYRVDSDHCTEFCELFRHRRWNLAPLTHADVDRHIRRYEQAYEVAFEQEDYDFIYEWAGGHPNMLEGVCRVLEEAIEAIGPDSISKGTRRELHQAVTKKFRGTSDLMYECAKIWQGCGKDCQGALKALFQPGAEPDAKALSALITSHIIRKVQDSYQPFSRLFSEYVQSQVAHDRPDMAKLWVDVESGEVIIGGKSVETLTNLEYKLMLLLFNNAEKIIDKYQIVTNVWGDSYIDEVDDARIEKLISRLRQKIEPDPSEPTYLATIRGRGYKLSLT